MEPILDPVDTDLNRALEESANEARMRDDRPLLLAKEGANAEIPQERTQFSRPLQHHFKNSHGDMCAAGFIVSAGAIDQFHKDFAPLIHHHGTAGSICGYLAAANAKLLCQAVESISPKNGLISEPDIEYLLAAVRDSAAVMKEVGEAMLFVHESRAAYLKLHGENFNERTSKAYMKSWVANYELSDFLAHNANKDLHEGNANVLYNFFRFNQYPQLAHATHEEAVRIAKDEAIFGGSVNVDGSITYANADSVFVVERFTPSRVLQTPSQWIQQERDQTGNENTKKDVKVFVIDLNGHFNAGFTCRTTELGNTAYMINSTDSNYLDRPSIAWLYDLVFMPSDSDGVTFPNLPSAPCDHSSTMAELISMGVEESLARDVLEKAHGDLRAAIDLLF